MQPDDPAKAAALTALEDMREKCQLGADGAPVMGALEHCFRHDLDVPEWLQSQILSAALLLRRAHRRSWDEAFGKVWRDGTRLEDERRRIELEEIIPPMVWELRQAGWPVDEAIFEEVAGQLKLLGFDKVSTGTVQRRYYSGVRSGRVPNLVALDATYHERPES